MRSKPKRTPHLFRSEFGGIIPDKGEVLSFIKTIVIIVIAVLFIRGSIIEAYKIPSGSMIPTLEIGDHILVSKFNYGLRFQWVTHSLWQYSVPERGDVVVFTRPDEVGTTNEDESKIDLIKRVIGIPGDTIEVRDAKVYVNGAAQEEPYARWDLGGDGSFGPVKVPEGHILLLGDNRDHSRDSRFWENPFLDVTRVKGRALIIYFSWPPSFSRIGTIIR